MAPFVFLHKSGPRDGGISELKLVYPSPPACGRFHTPVVPFVCNPPFSTFGSIPPIFFFFFFFFPPRLDSVVTHSGGPVFFFVFYFYRLFSSSCWFFRQASYFPSYLFLFFLFICFFLFFPRGSPIPPFPIYATLQPLQFPSVYSFVRPDHLSSYFRRSIHFLQVF